MAVGTEPGEAFYRRLASHAGLDFVSLDPTTPPEDGGRTINPLAARLLSREICQHFHIIPISYSDGVVTVAADDPFDELARDMAARLTGREVRFAVTPREEIERAIEDQFAPAPQGLRSVGLIHEPDAAAPSTYGRPLGQVLADRGLITEEQLTEALEEQGRTGSRVGEILVHSGMVAQSELTAALAEHFQLHVVDLSQVEPDPEALELVPEPLARHLRAVPIVVDEGTLYLAISDVLDDDTVAALREHTNLELRGLLAPRNDIDELMQRMFGGQYVGTARLELLNRFPDDCANRVITGAQRTFLIVVAALYLVALVIFPIPTLVATMAGSAVFYTSASVYKFKLTLDSLGHQYEVLVTDEELAALDERDLPPYTILVPLYDEAAVVPQLVAGIGALDYPKTKLDVRLLCEEDDDSTIDAIRELHLPPHFRLVVVPDAQPKTKPKACNYGLLQADGKYVVIYDAEDRPDPDQLKKVVVAYEKADEKVTCIQAKLNYFNQEQNLLTRWFAIEYAMWFDLVLPGLDAANAPIPLGGTSNHFITERLLELAAWDPFNVTEDADLGIRLHRAGYTTAMIDSTTLEEANSDLNNWIRQRSRWIKGYLQTYLVHMRNPGRLLRQIGFSSWMSFQLLIGGTAIFLLNPIFWTLTTIFFFTEAGLIREVFPSFVFYAAAFQLFIGNFVFVYLSCAGTIQRRYFHLSKYALLSPLYWGLMSIAAWKGFIQLFTNPFYWEKTEHGLDQPGGH